MSKRRSLLTAIVGLGLTSSFFFSAVAHAAANKPYVWALGDVSVGQGMDLAGAGCGVAVPANPKASAVGWEEAETNNPLYPVQAHYSSGSTSAVYALNHLQSFYTRTGNLPARGPMLPPLDLAFANTAAGQVNQATGMFGGKFAGGKCIRDTFPDASNPFIKKGDFKLSQLLFLASGAVPVGNRVSLYVDGDLYIDMNVEYEHTAYRTISDIPYFSVVVKGNIYIDHNVHKLEGIYTAQPSSSTATNGVIYTCATDSTPPFTPLPLDKNLYDSCNTYLEVWGSVSARQVQLMRTYGPVIPEYYGPHLDLVTEAENFVYSPLVWLSTQAGPGIFSPSKYDSITSLPPVL